MSEELHEFGRGPEGFQGRRYWAGAQAEHKASLGGGLTARTDERAGPEGASEQEFAEFGG